MLSTPVQAAADWVAQLTGARRALLAVFAGAISVLAFAPVHAWPVLFLSFGAARVAARRLPRAPCRAWRPAEMRGIHRVLVRLRLFPHRTLLDRRGVPGRALAPWLAHPLRHDGVARRHGAVLRGGRGACRLLWRPGPARVFALAIAFGLAEYARGHILTGLPWNLLGYGLAATLPMMQLAAIFGVYALSLLAVLLFASPFAIWAPQGSGLARPKGTALLTLAFCIALALAAVWGQRAACQRRCRLDRRAASHRAGQCRSGQ